MPKVRRCRYDTCIRLVVYPNYYCNEHKAYEKEYLDKRNKAREQYFERYNKVNRNKDKQTHNRYNFYRSKQWSSLRKQVLLRDNYLCQYCKAIGKLTPNSRTVDHIVPIEANSSLKGEVSNLATICRRCHRLKTDWEQNFYGTGKNNKLKKVSEIKSIKEIASRFNS